MNIMPQAMKLIVRGVNIEVVDVCHHTWLFLRELLEVGVYDAYMGPEGSHVTILVCKCKRTGCLAATHVPVKGMNACALTMVS